MRITRGLQLVFVAMVAGSIASGATLTTTTTMVVTPTAAAFGSLFTLTASVQDQNGDPVTNGSVTFYDGTTALGTVQVVRTTSGGAKIGTATLKTILVPLGANSLTATYVGGDAPSTSPAVVATVTGAYPSSTTLTYSGSPGDYTLTGTVAGAGPVSPTGNVAFTDNTTSSVVGQAALDLATWAQTFVYAPTIAGFSNPDVAALADVNGDGIPDLFIGSYTGLTLQLGNGDGTFQAPMPVLTSGATTDHWLALGDFNGDGNLDLAAAIGGNIVVLLGNGDGTFRTKGSFDSGNPQQIAVGDFNGDGILDLVALNTSTVDLLLGNGDGTFQAPVTYPVSSPLSLAVGDLNGDGLSDVVVGTAPNDVSIFLGSADGTLQAGNTYVTQYEPGYLLLADFRGIGKLDLATAFNQCCEGTNTAVSLMLGNGDGTFQAEQTILSGSNYSGLTAADFNGDGKLDLVVTDFGYPAINVLLGNGDGTFQSPTSYSAGVGPIPAAVADLNHDGRPDMIVPNYNDGTANVYLNRVTQTATLSNAVVRGTGPQSVTAAYVGDTNFAASTSQAVTLTATGTAAAPAATPTFSIPSGTYTSPQTVTISDTTSGATIYYTTNGTTPTTSSAQYTGAITVSSTETIEAIATASGYSTSAVAAATYTITTAGLPPAATPTFSIPAGTYTSAQTVTISDATAGATIYYTTNGTTPTTSSTQYTGSITVSSTETLEAIATANGYSSSAVATATYTISAQAQSGPSVSAAYQELHQRAVANASNFYVYLDQDSGLNHGYPSGWFGTISAITIDTGCIDNPADTVTGCDPSSDTAALDLTHGTVFRVTFAPLSADQYAGVNIEEPLNWGANGQPASNGYNLTGATAVSLDVRSPGGISVQFGVNSCTTSFIQLPASATYTTMTFSLDTNSLNCTPDLTSVHLLFTVVTNGSEAGAGGTVLMDNIRFTPVPPRTAQGSETLSLPLSTQTFGVVPQQASFPPDQANRNIAAIYEAALSVLGFLARGTPQDLADAQSIANALDYALHNDNQGDPLPTAKDGSAGLHNAYSSGDIALLNGQSTGALAGNVRLAGFTCGSASPTGFCLELNGATGGNNAFAIFALVAAYRQFGNATYLNDALEIANWIVGNLKDPTETGYGGYFVGYLDQVPAALNKGKSIENNADIFAAFTALAAVENELGNAQQAAQWTAYAKVAGDFVVQMFDSASGHFYLGTVLAGSPANPAKGNCQTPYMSKGNDVINTCDFLDSNTFTTLAMAGSGTYQNSIDWTRPINYVSTVYPQTISANGLSFQGVDIIPPPPAGIAWEFTGQFVETCQYAAALFTSSSCGTLAQTFLAQIGQAQTSAPFADGMGLVAATVNGENSPPNNLPPLDECLATPFQCIPERVGVAATVWAILASEKLNVFSPFPTANVSPGSLTFTGQQAGTTSAAQTVTLSNTGSVSLTISRITTSGNFAQTNNCGSSLAASGSCTISVTFAPLSGGPLTGTLTITDNNTTGSTQTVSLAGTGQDFTLAVASGSSSSQTVSPGQTATYALSASGEGGFNQSLSFSCTGAPSEATCTVSPNPATVGSSPTTLTVSITTTAASLSAPRSRPLPPLPPLSSGTRSLLVLAVLLAGMAWTIRGWRQVGGSWRRTVLGPLAAGLLLALALAGCGGGGSSSSALTNQGTPPGAYNLTVTGAAGSGSTALSHSVSLTLTVS